MITCKECLKTLQMFSDYELERELLRRRIERERKERDKLKRLKEELFKQNQLVKNG